MKYRLISSTGARRLILIFAGWGMDDNVFCNISRPGYDVMVVWDYRNLSIDWACVETYDEICVVAWSLGVYAASQTTHAIAWKVTKRIAVNGTLFPIDDTRGIPEAIYRGTLDNLNERSLAKFYRRMCASREDYEKFCAAAPERSVDGLAEELTAIADRMVLSSQPVDRWDLAVIGREDRIFSPLNQRRAWTNPPSGLSPVAVQVVDSGHYLDFEALVNRHFIDKDTMTRRFATGMSTYTDNAVVQAEVINRMMSMAAKAGVFAGLKTFSGNVLEIGSGTGMLTNALTGRMPDAKFTLWDIAASCPDGLAGLDIDFKRCDAELQLRRVTPATFSIIASASTIQWFNSPESFFGDVWRALKPGGYAILSTYVSGNMHQISDLTGNALPLPSAEAWLGYARRWFSIVDYAAYERDLDFESPVDVLRHLKLTGVNSLSRSSSGTVDVRTIISRYPMMLDARYHLTYRPLIMILHKI